MNQKDYLVEALCIELISTSLRIRTRTTARDLGLCTGLLVNSPRSKVSIGLLTAQGARCADEGALLAMSS